MQKATQKMMKDWKVTYEQYKAKVNPNRKTALEIIEHLKQNYPVTEVTNDQWKKMITHEVLENEHSAKKLPAGKQPFAVIFSVQNTGAGTHLYKTQDKVFKGQNIFVGIEIETGHFHVEGSSLLWDELFAIRGLDEDDLTNFYLVAQYISCLKKFDLLGSVLAQAD